MTLRGIIRDGRVELEGGASLPEGTPVDVEPSSRARTKRRKSHKSLDPAYRLSELAVSSGRRDGSIEHDHYIYGTPKRGEAIPKPARRKGRAKARKRP